MASHDDELPAPLLDWLHELGWPRRTRRALTPDGYPVIPWLVSAMCSGTGDDVAGYDDTDPRVNEHDALPLLEELLAHLDDPCRVAPDGTGALHHASRSPRTTERLLAAGFPVNASDVSGITPLHKAVAVGNTEVVGLLLAAGADPHSPAKRFDALTLAVQGQHAELVDRFLDLGLTPNRRLGENAHTALMSLSYRDNDALLSRLLAAGADASLVGADGYTALIQALRTGASPDAVRRLLDAGACVHPAPGSCWTPLLVAASANPLLIPLLLDAGALASVVEEREHGGPLDAPLALVQAWLYRDPWDACSVDDFRCSPARFTALLHTLLDRGASTRHLDRYLANQALSGDGDDEARAQVDAALYAWHLAHAPVQPAPFSRAKPRL